MANVTCDGYQFSFPSARNAYKFDQTDKLSPHYHGVNCMKAVDVMVEFPNYDLFVEIKEPYTLENKVCATCGNKINTLTWLKNNIIKKYRDTFLYRYAEGKADKPITYICLVDLDSKLLLTLKKNIQKELPVGIANKNRWNRALVEKIIVVNIEAWKRNYPDWSINRV